ncbi:hypothetical protein F4818DRAFT_445952 [Hypoxylon cercidicola]|nr:hypothetical protein F4818DRAFT_445952 [Hypoxylon cercidicola]
MQFAVGWTPFGLGGVAATFLAAMGASCMLVASILIVTIPEQQSYWYQVFPSTAISSLSPDLTYTAAQIIASNSVSLEPEVGKSHDTVMGYRGALYLAVGLCVAVLVLDIGFVRLVRDNREGWEDPADADSADDIVAPVATGTELRELRPELEQR